ncbi:hypothetical protein ACJIZ3_019835 [Penstemon smallii]|uniref:Knottins-like domain-containing protein n=1 Tax=Penstemon smallii TaxID=265156 RepID=A0ABD3T3S4_9LAMI
MIWSGEAATCEAPSRLFKGLCFSRKNCGTICEKEGFLFGHCRNFKCTCAKDCGSVGGDPGQGPPGEGPPEQDPPSEGPPEQGPPGEGPPDQDPPSEGPPEQDPPSEGPPEQGPPSEDPPEESPPSDGDSGKGGSPVFNRKTLIRS